MNNDDIRRAEHAYQQIFDPPPITLRRRGVYRCPECYMKIGQQHAIDCRMRKFQGEEVKKP